MEQETIYSDRDIPLQPELPLQGEVGGSYYKVVTEKEPTCLLLPLILRLSRTLLTNLP
jgi:hypothetical protein